MNIQESHEFIALALNPMVRRGTKGQRRQMRALLRKRDGDNCCWCHEPMDFRYSEGAQRAPLFATIEHIVPLNKGGGDGLDNLALAHRRCNQARNATACRMTADIIDKGESK